MVTELLPFGPLPFLPTYPCNFSIGLLTFLDFFFSDRGWGGRVVTGGWDKELAIWDWRNGKVLRKLVGHSDRINSVQWSHNGRMIASGSEDKLVRLWDPQSGKEIGKFAGHDAIILSIAFKKDDRILISGSADNTVKVCDLSFFSH
jgi:WD40 repeat protein